MSFDSLSADNTNIVSVQLNLFDSFDEKPVFNEVLNQKIRPYTDLDLENGVVLTSPNHFEFDTRRCPKCGKFTLIKKKFVQRKVILDKIGDVVFYLKEYFCKTCHSYPKVELKNILNKYSKVSIPFKENFYKKARTGIKSFRKTSKDIEADDGTLSHQSVFNHLSIDSECELRFDVGEISGYLAYDEQFIKIKNKNYPKAQLIDTVTNRTIGVRFYKNVTSINVKKFLKDFTEKDERKCLVTDHDNTYPAVINGLGFQKQQLCLVHFWDIVDYKVKDLIKENNYTDEEIKELKKYANRIKSIFQVDTVKDFIYRLNRFFKLWDSVPEDLKLFYNKKVVKDMHKLTHYLFDPNIPNTNNQLEGKFSGAQKESDKKRFKTIKGCLSYLKPIIERQNDELQRTKDDEKEDNTEPEYIIKLRKSIKQLFKR
ncbi:MAG: hypothetical protein FWC41_12140 [Firmicutes bacterium]|nr:hypothetical protein [Bacillota bacterium]